MPEQEIIVLDSQRVNTFQNCAYKYDLTFNKSLEPVVKAEPLESGDLMHKMLEHYYTERGKVPFEQLVNECIKRGETHAVTLQLPIEIVYDVVRVFKEYTEFYRHEPHMTLTLNGRAAVEQTGSKVMYEDEFLKIIYETKIDWICTVGNIEVLPVDHKTSKRRGETVAISNQFMGYCWMLNVRNLMVNKIGFQTSLKPHEKFSRPLMSYALPVIEAWVDNTVWWVKMLHYSMKTGHWPQNFTSCDKYSGCIFRPICESTPDTRGFKSSELYKIGKKWDVGKELESE